jgi:hypothetical protein
MNCPLCTQKLKRLHKSSTSYVCAVCRSHNPNSSAFHFKNTESGKLRKLFITLGNYRIINDCEDDKLAILTPIKYESGCAGPSYNTLYEGKSVDIDPLNIEALKRHIKTILIFM